MKARIKRPPARAALFGINETAARKITALFAAAGIETVIYESAAEGEKIGALLNAPGYPKKGGTPVCLPKDTELILFADLDEKALDKALAALREKGLTVRFKAVLTKYNAEFTLDELMVHMLDEEKTIAERNGN